MLRRVPLVRTDVSEECIASIMVTRIVKLGTVAVSNNLRCSEMSVLIRSTRRNIQQDTIRHSHRF
jgi:hypothetical protein